MKAKSTCRACGKMGHWANDAICEMKGKKQHPFNKYMNKGAQKKPFNNYRAK